MSQPLSWLQYESAFGQEFCLKMGPCGTRAILFVPPLFDEMNRLRSTLVATMRRLAALGVGSLLPDLPGCNESVVPLEIQDLPSWRGAVNAAATQLGATHIASLRGGALVDGDPAGLPHWRLNPTKGSPILKTMLRSRILSDRELGRTTSEEELRELAKQAPIELSGNRVGTAMFANLEQAVPVAVDRLALRTIGQDIAGSPLWLRAEPQQNLEMAFNIATDLEAWSASCGE